MKKIAQFICVVVVVLLGVSCKKYLDVAPDNTGTLEYAFRNRNETENYLFTCYATLQQFANATTNAGFTTSGEIIYPNNLTKHPIDETGFSLLRGTQNSSQPGLDYWDGENSGQAVFRSIRRCNTMLENIDKPVDLSVGEKKEVDSGNQVFKSLLSLLPGPLIRTHPVDKN